MAVVATTMLLPHTPRVASSSTYLPSKPWPCNQPRSRPEAAPIALPSIWQVIPELDHLTSPPADKLPAHGNKRSRRALEEREDDEEELARAKQVPRIYQNPEMVYRQASSPHSRAASLPTSKWTSPSSMAETARTREAPRPQVTLPSLYATINAEGDDRPRALEGRRGSPGAGGHPGSFGSAEPAYTLGGTGYDFSYHASSCWHSHPPSPVCGYERQSPFSAGPYPLHHHEVGPFGDMGMLGTGPDAKPRKRRGNLPKETTDKLRAWFAKNLRHPYPSEEQKQDLIRQTGLQMNQIANWFINARRRHLPAMLEAARKDDDAQNMGNPGSMGSSSVTPASLPPSLASSPRSECHGLGRRRMSPVKRGSV